MGLACPRMRFVLLFRNDPTAALSMIVGGQSSAEFLEQAVGQFKGSAEQIIPVVGRYDTVVVCDFPSHADLLAFTMAANASGQQIEALPAATLVELNSVRDLSQQVASAQQQVSPEETTRQRPEPTPE